MSATLGSDASAGDVERDGLLTLAHHASRHTCARIPHSFRPGNRRQRSVHERRLMAGYSLTRNCAAKISLKRCLAVTANCFARSQPHSCTISRCAGNTTPSACSRWPGNSMRAGKIGENGELVGHNWCRAWVDAQGTLNPCPLGVASQITRAVALKNCCPGVLTGNF